MGGEEEEAMGREVEEVEEAVGGTHGGGPVGGRGEGSGVLGAR